VEAKLELRGLGLPEHGLGRGFLLGAGADAETKEALIPEYSSAGGVQN